LCVFILRFLLLLLLLLLQHRLHSLNSRDICYVNVTNSTPYDVRMLWLDYQGNEVCCIMRQQLWWRRLQLLACHAISRAACSVYSSSIQRLEASKHAECSWLPKIPHSFDAQTCCCTCLWCPPHLLAYIHHIA
jgi:hypothetical protein